MPEEIKNIVLAEDDEDEVSLFYEAVNEVCPSVKVTTAKNGEELLKILEEIPLPDIIILDLNMPRIGGSECLRSIRSNTKYNDVPVIIYSTAKNKTEIDDCLTKGGDYYMVKPGSYKDLTAFVNGICRGILKDRFTDWK